MTHPIVPDVELDVVPLEPGVFGDSRHHPRADLGLIVKGELVGGPVRPDKEPVRSALTFHAPP